MNIKVSERDLVRFQQDLWKDARKLKVNTGKSRKYIQRYSDGQASVIDEFRFITGMVDKISFKIPSIVDHTDNSISFDYIAGTRAFNLLMDLRSLHRQEKKDIYHDTGFNLIQLLAEDLQEFQSYYQNQSDTLKKIPVYPARSKINSLYSLLSFLLSLENNPTEFDPIIEIYEQNAVIPFRDATPKNVILDLPNLFKKRFKSNKDRQETIKRLVLSGELKEKLKHDIIYHIDFSGCCYLCPMHDDWVALREHEAAAWLKQERVSKIEGLTNLELCVKFVRYSRLGGRKLAYKLLNNQGYQIRFEMDSEVFYFEKLKKICFQLTERGVLRSNKLEILMDQLIRATNLNPEIDYFHAWKKNCGSHSYYSDVFPG